MRLVVKSEYLKSFFDSLSVLVTESRVRFSDSGIRASAVSGSLVAMVTVEMPKESMEEYSFEKELVVGVDVDRVNRVLKSCDGNVEISVDNELKINTKDFSYSISLIDPSALRDEPKSGNLKFTSEFSVKAGDLRNAINAASKVSDDVVIRTDSDGVHIEAKGDVDRISISLPIQGLPEARSMYDSEYLKNFLKIAKPEDTVNVQIGTKYPVRISIKLHGGKLSVDYLLAPKVESYDSG
jgi:proliferating cell nuclear antigen